MMHALDQADATRARWVADQNGVVGYVQLSRCWLDTRAALVEVLTLTPLAVLPEHQRRGIATALIEAALQHADRLGYPAVFLEGDQNFYRPRGFECAEDLGLLRPSPRIPRPAFHVARLSRYRSDLVGQFVYPDVMWVNDCVGLRDPRLARMEAELE